MKLNLNLSNRKFNSFVKMFKNEWIDFKSELKTEMIGMSILFCLFSLFMI